MSKINLPERERRGRKKGLGQAVGICFRPLRASRVSLCHCVSLSQAESKTKKCPQGCLCLGGQLKVHYLVRTQEPTHGLVQQHSLIVRAFRPSAKQGTQAQVTQIDGGTCQNEDNPKMRTFGLAPVHRAPGEKGLLLSAILKGERDRLEQRTQGILMGNTGASGLLQCELLFPLG